MSGQDLSDGGSVRTAHPAPATWDQAAAQYLVCCAVRRAPPDLAQRLEEEWLADLTARRGAFSRIRFGLGCCWATRVIAREFGAAVAATSGRASGQRLLVAYGDHDFSRFSRRTTALIAIVCLHAAIFYAYMSGLAQRIVDEPARRMGATFIVEPRAIYRPAPLPPPTVKPHIVDRVPKVDLPLIPPAQPSAITVPHASLPPAIPVPSPAPQPPNVAMGGPGAGFPNTGDYYPAGARRLGETGAAAVRVCVNAGGRLTAEPVIVQSSGIASLDEGALRLARAGSGHYRPTTENGRPVTACYSFRIRFQLQDQ